MPEFSAKNRVCFRGSWTFMAAIIGSSSDVAAIGESRMAMHNYLLSEHLMQVELLPPERVHPKLWKGVNCHYKPLDWVYIERKRHNKERTSEEHKKLVDGILRRDQKRRRKIEAAGIDYECPEIVGSNDPAPKKIRLEE